MGRHAQQRKRGGHLGDAPGLPAGPTSDEWDFYTYETTLSVVWTGEPAGPFDFFRGRWRQPANSPLWTFGLEVSNPTTDQGTSTCPFLLESEVLYQAEIMFCDVDGHPLSQWSAYKEFSV